ncbi:hypothetical protein [Mucilaginibacter lacusdianchii]|uniref:hypothetical protein n=1 Tax=Mucilaginibacter lacusdianchii TaxID=2684211 RepID=UPI00131C2E27|nr:hypothetical protein [Mucilaginibacter sp. JXJ CY 39]
MERAPDHQTQPITYDDYVDAIMFYCKKRKLNWGCADSLNEATQVYCLPDEESYEHCLEPAPARVILFNPNGRTRAPLRTIHN